ncbi:nudix hydrolase 8-like [Macadamia integrifolia]|uniref:nudix hydrolase 8-like n=1 Tax=Macadamia integrifolia TaxID=60698 RepID=UPI001C4E3113|nr:nudix hydrolase 8-like [Macadamia integrifolia]
MMAFVLLSIQGNYDLGTFFSIFNTLLEVFSVFAQKFKVKVRYSVINFFLSSEGLKVKFVNPVNVRYISFSVSSSSVMEHVVSENVAQPIELLHGVEDKYGGVILYMKDPLDSEVFVAALRASISKWRQEGKKGIWMNLPIELVNLVEAAVKEGFYYHHAEPTYLMLVYWIPETPSTIPANASHRVGVGACVINDEREVLHLRLLSISTLIKSTQNSRWPLCFINMYVSQ